MGPPSKWWQPVKTGIYRNGTFFSLEDANSYVRALFDLIESDRRSKLFCSKHNLIDPRFTPVGLCSNETFRRNKETVSQVAKGTLEDAFLKLRVGRITGREAFRFDSQSEPVVRYAYEVGVYIVHDPSEPKGFVVITAYPRNEEPMILKSMKPPKAFFDFAERMFQDFEHFETLEDLLRFGLQGIAKDRLGDFTAYVKRIENREIGDKDLETLWHRSGADFGYPAAGLRIFLRKARELAEREGPNNSLYRRRPKWSTTPSSKDLG